MLWFGEFKGKTVEQIILLPGGYQYLLGLREKTELFSDRNQRFRLKQLIDEVFMRGENLPVIAKCRCGDKIATHTSVVKDEDRYIFLELLCDDCKENVPPEKPRPLPIKLASLIATNQDLATQTRLLRQFKYCFFKNEKERITKPTAQKLFFPELYSQPEPPDQNTGQTSSQVKRDQLSLFQLA